MEFTIRCLETRESVKIDEAVLKLVTVLVDEKKVDCENPLRLTAHYANGGNKPFIGFAWDYPQTFRYRQKGAWPTRFHAAVPVAKGTNAIDLMLLVYYRLSAMLVMHGIHFSYRYDTCWWFRVDTSGFSRNVLLAPIEELELREETLAAVKEKFLVTTARDLAMVTQIELEVAGLTETALKNLQYALGQVGLWLGMTQWQLDHFIPPERFS